MSDRSVYTRLSAHQQAPTLQINSDASDKIAKQIDEFLSDKKNKIEVVKTGYGVSCLNQGFEHHRSARNSRPIIGVHVETGETLNLPSVNSSDRKGFSSSNIFRALNGTAKDNIVGGYRWSYKQ